MMLSIGDLVLDVTVAPKGPLKVDDDNPATITVGGGGQAANFCAWAAALGEQARLVTRVGEDDAGRLLLAQLETLKVDVRVVWAKEPTGAIAVLVSPNGARTMATQRGATTGMRPDDLREEWFEGVQLIHVPGYSLFEEPLASATQAAIGYVRRAGGQVAVDLSSAAGLEEYGPPRMVHLLEKLRADLLFATKHEADVLSAPLDRLAKVPVIKLGSGGCSILGEVTTAPVVDEVDPTGAGDAFAAAFCASYLRGANLGEAARRAVDVAAGAVTTLGARPK